MNAPMAIEAEQAVIGGLMLNPDALLKVSGWLSDEDFYRADHGLIYRAITGLVDKKSPCDAVTMGDWFETNGIDFDRSYLMDLANNTPSAYNIVAYAEIVVEKARLRAAMDAGSKLVSEASRQGASSEEVIGAAAQVLAGMHGSKLRGGLEPIRGTMQALTERMFARYGEPDESARKLLGMPWPWQKMNEVTSGMRAGVLYVIGARPNMGKSVFGVQAAVHAAIAGSNVAVFSVEMTAEEVLNRAVAMEARVPHSWVEDPKKGGPDEEMWWNRLTGVTSSLLGASIQIDETPGINIDQLMARARRAHRQKKIDLIVVDHMHDMGIDPRKEVRHEYGRITQGAKTLAKELGCAVILMAQLNRKADGKEKPKMTDLRESGEIEQKADVIMFLHRDDYYDPKTQRRGIVDVILAKGRNIRTGQDIELSNQFAQMRLGEMDEWEIPYDEPESNNWEPKSVHRGFGRRP